MTVKVTLTSVPIFQFVAPTQLKDLADIAKIVEKNKGDLILMQGEAVAGIYLIAEGAAGVHAAKPERLLVELKAGESFGEMSYLEKTKASATIRAEARATKLIVFLHADLTELVNKDPSLGQALFHGIALQLSQKLRYTTTKLAEELALGQKFLTELEQAGDGNATRASMVTDLEAHGRFVVDNLDGAIASLDDLTKKMPEKAGSFGAVNLTLSDLRSKVKAFSPRLVKQVAAMLTFVARIEDLVARSTQG